MKSHLPLILALLVFMLWAVPNANVVQTKTDSHALTSDVEPGEVSYMRQPDSFAGNDGVLFDGSGYPPVILQDTTLLYCPDTSMFSHPSHLPSDAWSAATSDLYSSAAYKVWENFAVSGEICDIHWWGLTLEYNAGWFICYETSAFDIIFYPDDGTGKPDTANPACSYLGVIPTQDTTGFHYHTTNQYPLWRFDIENLTPCCTLETGWVSIQGVSQSSPDCWFLWMSSGTGDGISWQWNGTDLVNTGYDRSLCLTGTGGAAIGMCCYGDFYDPTCIDTTEAYCISLGGTWYAGLNCTDHGCPSCNFVCPPSAVFEGEPPCSTEYIDLFNGGCNSSPAIWSAYNAGDTVCGETGTYLRGSSNYRDTDWYEFTLAETLAVVFTASVELPFQILLGYPGSPDPCTGYSFPWATTAAECDTASLSAILIPGTYWAWIGPSLYSGWPCGAQYWFVVETIAGTGTVAGQVTDVNTTSPVEGAIVTATWVSASIVDTTDATGNYSINITPGDIEVTVEAVGYVTDSQNVTVVQDQTTTHNVVLDAPEASINDSPITGNLAPGDTIVYTRTLSNTGTATLNYNVSLNFNVGPQITIQRNFESERITNVVDPMGHADVAPFSNNFPVIAAQGDSLFSSDLLFLGDTQLLGIEFDGTYFWITGGNSGTNPNWLYQLDSNGLLVNTYDQGTTSTWGWRDLAWDGTYLYASDENEFAQIDPTTGSKVGTLPKPSGLTVVRAVAYDPDTDHFWSANFSTQIYEFDRTGAVIHQFGNTLSAYGMAWDDISADGPWLWVFSQNGTPEFQISQFDPINGIYTGVVYQGILPSGFTAGLAGGATITTDLPGYTDLAVMLVLVQGTPNDFMAGYEIAPNIGATWLSVQSGGSGTIDPGLTADVKFLVDFRDPSIVPDSTYQAIANINNNDPYANPAILFSITATEASGCDYVAGDVNGSDSYNGLDITYGVAYFKGGPEPICPFGSCPIPPCDAFFYCGDVNGSCSYNGLDITYGVAYFKGGPGPVPCPSCPPIGGPAGEIERPAEQPQTIKGETSQQKGIDLN